MKLFSIFLSALLLLGCEGKTDNNPQQNYQEIPSVNAAYVINIPEFSVEKLTPEIRREFENIIPQKTRSRLETAEDFNVIIHDKTIKLQRKEERKKLLDSIYWDLANTLSDKNIGDAVSCVDPQYQVEATLQDENLLTVHERIKMSYGCGWIDVSGKRFRLARRDSKTVFDQLAVNANVEEASSER
jgi:hypothetical protein